LAFERGVLVPDFASFAVSMAVFPLFFGVRKKGLFRPSFLLYHDFGKNARIFLKKKYLI
jgi:hypothetical protein